MPFALALVSVLPLPAALDFSGVKVFATTDLRYTVEARNAAGAIAISDIIIKMPRHDITPSDVCDSVALVFGGSSVVATNVPGTALLVLRPAEGYKLTELTVRVSALRPGVNPSGSDWVTLPNETNPTLHPRSHGVKLTRLTTD